jgi:hypothetical protein
MEGRLYGEDGELNSAGVFSKYAAGLIGLISAICFLPAAFIGLLSQMMCGSSCSGIEMLAVLGMTSSVILLPISAMAGIINFRGPSILLTMAAVLPAAFVTLGFALGFGLF